MINKNHQSDEKCPICHENLDFYCYGSCSHMTCLKCAIKLKKFEPLDKNSSYSSCPSCRVSLNKVVIMSKFVPFNLVNTTSMRQPLSEPDSVCQFYFENQDIEKAYTKQLICVCPICGHQAPSMIALNRHTSNEHDLFYCDLCIKHARMLPSEFLPMTKDDLMKHKHYDKNKKKGHPPCNFCNERFYEFEDLIKHIKDVHFMCDICNIRGIFEVFRVQDELFHHYETSHFVCEICRSTDVITYFANSDELGIHRLTKHGDQSWNPLKIKTSRHQNNVSQIQQTTNENITNPTVLFREDNPAEWTDADFPTLNPSNRDDNQLDQQSLQEFRSGLRTAVEENQKRLKKSNPAQSLAQIVSSNTSYQVPQVEDFPSLSEGNFTNRSTSWVVRPVSRTEDKPREAQTAPIPADFPSLGLSSHPKDAKKKTKKSQEPIDFSDLSLVKKANQNQPLSSSAQRIIEGQTKPKKLIPQTIKPLKSHQDIPLSSIREVLISQRFQRRGQRAYIDESIETKNVDNSFRGIVRVEELPNGSSSLCNVNIPSSSNGTVNIKADFPSLTSNVSKNKDSQAKSKKINKSESNKNEVSNLKKPDPEASSLVNIKYFISKDFATRTRSLMEKLTDFFDEFGTTKSAFKSYMDISRQYLEGVINGQAYLEFLCGLQNESKIAANPTWKDLRPNLIGESINLLPNVARQRALLRNLKAKTEGTPYWFDDVFKLLFICKICKQVCLKIDFQTHNIEANHDQ